jgi:hypothetical protein
MEPTEKQNEEFEELDEPFQTLDGPIGKQNFVHTLMLKVHRVSLAAVVAVVALYALLAYQGIIPTATHGTGVSGAARLTTTGVTACDRGSDAGSGGDRSLAPIHGPR